MGAHTFVSVRIHYVFGTASREHVIKNDQQSQLWAYMAGIARNIGATVYAVGGMDDHAHVFIRRAGDDACGESSTGSKGEFVAVDARERRAEVRVAGRLRRF